MCFRAFCAFFGVLFLMTKLSLPHTKCFDVVKSNIPITDIEQFKKEYSDYEIKDVFIYDRFFFKDGRLIGCDHKFYGYYICEGGVLNNLA